MENNEKAHAYTNRLIDETSPYLLQHAHNPVDWYGWGEEAFTKAKAENKPILLSVGYSACHWCHVMERESFENPDTAALMNEYFVNIKVDREERPDVDSIYMEAVQIYQNGSGGWPMTVFLTPEGLPFYGGTYFPPDDRHPQIPSFPRLLNALHEAYTQKSADIEHNVNQMRQALQTDLRERLPKSGNAPDHEMLDEALDKLARNFDTRNGGLGGAPKFPQAMVLDFALRGSHRANHEQLKTLLKLTFDKMANGGIYDQLGGGFARYSVDARWLVPHFEKMLYDNAQLALLYLQAWQMTGHEFYKYVCTDVLDYILREMTSPEGGFYSATDADSEGEEGKFFVWSKREIDKILGDNDAQIFNAYYGVTERGNFEGHNILNVAKNGDEIAHNLNINVEELQAVLNRSREKLFAERETRIRPGLDDKILTSWNGLMLKALAVAGSVLNEPNYLEAAVKNAGFVTTQLLKDGRLLHTFKSTPQGGIAKLNGYLEDYAFYADALLALYEATFDLKWLEQANQLGDIMVNKFWDNEKQGFYDTSSDHEALVTRPINLYDNAVPSGNSVAVDVMLRLATFTDDPQNIYRPKIKTTMESMGAVVISAPTAFGRLLSAMEFYLGSPKEIVIIGDKADAATQALLEVVYSRYLPNKVLMVTTAAEAQANGAKFPLLADRNMLDGKPTAYVCQNYACQRPVTTPADLASLLN
jgi:uncharacterized protein